MGTVGIYDWDFFNYSPVIPNLECGKLCAYHKNHRDVTILTCDMIPYRFSTFYIRKDYDDGLYPKELFYDNVRYGGKAFNENYISLETPQECTEPDFSDYVNFSDYYGATQTRKTQFKQILRGAHCRLSVDGENINPHYDFERLIKQNTSGFIVHDYNLANVKGAYKFLADLGEKRLTVNGEKIKRIPIGNKFPIITKNGEDFYNWIHINIMNGFFFLQHEGLLEDEALCSTDDKVSNEARQLIYNPCKGYKEEDFVGEPLERLFKQVLFLRETRKPVRLQIDEGFSNDFNTLITLFNLYLGASTRMNNFIMPNTLTFYRFCSNRRLQEKRKYNYNIPTLEAIRGAFAYVRLVNYDLFNAFYQNENTKLQGGKLIYD